MTTEKKTQGRETYPGPPININYAPLPGGEWMGIFDDTNTTTGGKGERLALVMADSLEKWARMYGYGEDFAAFRAEVAFIASVLRGPPRATGGDVAKWAQKVRDGLDLLQRGVAGDEERMTASADAREALANLADTAAQVTR